MMLFQNFVLALWLPSVQCLSELTVKILAQRRPESLERLLDSLAGASYPRRVVIDVEINIDGAPSSWTGDDHKRVVQVAHEFQWPLGEVSVIQADSWRGLRQAWLECTPKNSLDETRFIVFEDDLELSEAWFLYLSEATRNYARAPSVAGIALQRQSRLDGSYEDEEVSGQKRLPALNPEIGDDRAFLFPHVGSWGFAPEPRVWTAFLRWYDGLVDIEDPKFWSVGTNGESFTEGPYIEALPSAWYRRDRNRKSMWTAHFDAFCAEHGLYILHPEIHEDYALAASWREDGEHYTGLSRELDTPVLPLVVWDRIAEGLFPAQPKVISMSGAPVSEDHVTRAKRKYSEKILGGGGGRHAVVNAVARQLLDVNWGPLSAGQAITDVSGSVQGNAFGYTPLHTFTKEEALCVLEGKKVAILGDSITRYFVFTLNYFLKFGTVNPEFGEVNGGCETWGCATRDGDVYIDSEYFDIGDVWFAGTDRSTSRTHRQHFTTSFEKEVETEFWFITDTWFDDLATLAADIKTSHDVLIVNSGWWEFVASVDDHAASSCPSTGVDSNDVSVFYDDDRCIDSFAADLTAMVTDLLEDFVTDAEKAVIWRQTSCCGFNINGMSDSAIRRGATAVAMFNSVTEKIMADENIEIADFSSFQNTVNTGRGDPDDPFGRTWDGAHPRAAQNMIWIQILLNKIARQLGREDSCVDLTPTPSMMPSTTAPTAASCRNGLQDGIETDIDCGGPQCQRCALSRACVLDNDCVSRTCHSGTCVVPPTPAPTLRPTTEAVPTRSPVAASPPNNNGGGGGGFEYGNGDNIREEVTFQVGNTTFSCTNSNDGIVYEDDAFAPNDCPHGGQKVLLAVLAALLLAHALAYYRERRKGVPTYAAREESQRSKFIPNNTKKKTTGSIEDELSRSALHVLQQMESIEEAKGSPQPMHKNNLSSVLEDEPINDPTDATHIELQRIHTEFQSHHSSVYQQSHRRVGSSRRHPRGRTTASLVNRSLMHTGAAAISSYHEPHQGCRTSSVAFSFYDGGDSDSEEEEPSKALETMPPPPKEEASILAATSVALEFALLLGICVICEHGMPSGLLPAGSTTVSENIDLFTFLVASLFLISYINVEKLDDGADVFLSRAQANEWKGWMQVAFVAYHYTNAQDVYVPIRWAVSGYVWLTGFGNAVYFWTSADFSIKRFAQQLWRINFLAAFLSLATGTPWIEYYFVALANVHFIVIFISLMIARKIGELLKWRAPNKKTKEEALLIEKFLGVAIVVAIDCLIWLDDRGDGKGPYDLLLRWWLRDISDYFEWYFYLRTKMDYLSSVPGMLFAIAYVPFRDHWSTFSKPVLASFYLGAGALLAIAIWIASQPQYCCDNGAEYRKINPYIGTLWIPFYLLIRNAHPYLTQRVAKPIEWIGMHSLEFYLLQFHVFLTKQSKRVLYVIPKEDWSYTNMSITLLLYVLVSAKALELTNAIRAIVWRASRLQVLLATAWVLIASILLADRWAATTCDAYTWTVWAVLAAIAIFFALFWSSSSSSSS